MTKVLNSLSTPYGLVRKFTGSSVIGFKPTPPRNDEKRVISCDFQMKLPTNAVRIDISLLLSTNMAPNDCEDQPSLSYKITICTPRCYHEDEKCNSNTTSKHTTTSTLNWSSKFTMPKGSKNIDPFHEWSGTFVLGNMKEKDLSQYDFHQIEGIFSGHKNEKNYCTIPIVPFSHSVQEMNTGKAKKKNIAEEVTSGLPERKRRRKNSVDP